MLKLMKMEWKKNHIGKYVIKSIVVAAFLLLFLYALAYMGIANDPETGVPDVAEGNDMISAFIETFAGMSFLIMGGVMQASFIVGAYRNGTMSLMFSYPIKRRKIIVSQMLAVWIFDFLALVVTKLLLYGSILVGACFMTSSFPIDYNMADPVFYLQMVVNSAVTVSVTLIALFVGMMMRSTKATIVASFVLVFLTQGNIGTFTLKDNVVFLTILMLVSIAFAFLSVYKVETKDLM